MSASVPGVIELRSLQVPVDFAVTGLLLMLFCIFFALSCVFANTLLSEGFPALEKILCRFHQICEY